VFVDAPWPADQTAVVVVARPDGAPIAGPIVDRSPLELELEAEPPFRIHARTYEAGALGGGCAVAIGGEGFELPPPAGAYVADIADLESDVVFAVTGEPADFDLVTTCAPAVTCPRASVRHIPLEPLIGHTIVALQALDSTLVVVGSNAVRAGSPLLLRLDGGDADLLDTSTVPGALRSLAAGGGTVYGATVDAVFAYDDATRAFEVAPMPVPIKGVEPVPGSPPIAFGDTGIFEVFATRTATAPIETFRSRVRAIEVLRSDLAVLIDESNLLYSFDGAGWTEETPLQGVQIESFRRVAGGAGTFVAIGLRENAFLREGSGWRRLPPPFDRGRDLSDVVHLGGSRYVVAGDFGSAAHWDGSTWCPIELETTLDLHRASAAGGDVVFIGTQPGPDLIPVLIEVTFL
jgi:hypothetical protein